MQLKNKTEREKFLEDYKSWELWKEIPELELKFYRKVLPNGTVIIATEFVRMVYDGFNPKGHRYKKKTDAKLHLLLADGDEFSKEYQVHPFKVYNPMGDSKTEIIDYLTKKKPEV